MLKIYGDRRTGNCLKVLYVAEHLGLAFKWIDNVLRWIQSAEQHLELA